uniref:Potassium channel domain-containing protein n=1 Tax=Haptolina ericina TaxID=156174 RepID=A0A7S3B3S5_9EUKA
MTITSIGYGDIYPTSMGEQWVAIFVMLLGSMLWGQVIATFCGVMSNLNPERTEFRRTMDDLNRFMRLNHLDHQIKTRLREYFHQTKHLKITAAGRNLMLQMSPMLQGEICWRVNQRWLERVWFLRNAEPSFLLQMALHLEPIVFAPGELAPPGSLYIVHRGIALYGGKVLTAGKVWGEDMILSNGDLRLKWCARAMNYLEAFTINRERLLDIAIEFPETYAVIRRNVMLLALRRHLLTYARQHSIALAKKDSSGSFLTSGALANSTAEAYMPEAAIKAGIFSGCSNGSPSAAASHRQSVSTIACQPLAPLPSIPPEIPEGTKQDDDAWISSATPATDPSPASHPGGPPASAPPPMQPPDPAASGLDPKASDQATPGSWAGSCSSSPGHDSPAPARSSPAPHGMLKALSRSGSLALMPQQAASQIGKGLLHSFKGGQARTIKQGDRQEAAAEQSDLSDAQLAMVRWDPCSEIPAVRSLQ